MHRAFLCLGLLGACAGNRPTNAEPPATRTVVAEAPPTDPVATPVTPEASPPDAGVESSAPEEAFDPALCRELALNSAIHSALIELGADETGKGRSSHILAESRNRFVLHAVVDAPATPDSTTMKRHSFLVASSVHSFEGTPIIWVHRRLRTEELAPGSHEIARFEQLSNWPSLKD